MPRCRCSRLPLLLSLLASSTVAPALEAVDPVGGASGGSNSNPLSLPWLTNVAENQTSAAVGARRLSETSGDAGDGGGINSSVTPGGGGSGGGGDNETCSLPYYGNHSLIRASGPVELLGDRLVLSTTESLLDRISGPISVRAGRTRRPGTDGAGIVLIAGEATQRATTGGSIYLSAGNGTSTDQANGGDGGAVTIEAGYSHGLSYKSDAGGALTLRAGGSALGNGGAAVLTSGLSERGSSGSISVSSAASGTHGVSGAAQLATGSSQSGASGAISLVTGNSRESHGGEIVIQVGEGTNRDGGDVSIDAGRTTGQGRLGGSIYLTGGEGSSTHSIDGGDGGHILLVGGQAKGGGSDDHGGEL